MKILVITQYFYPETFRINDIVKGLVERGHKVDVLTSLPNVPGGEFYDGYSWRNRGEKELFGARIERVGVIKRGKGTPLRWVLNCASFAFNSLFHLPHLNKNNYDAVFVFNNSPVSVIYPAKVFAKRNKIPSVVFLLDIWPESMFLLLGVENEKKDNLVMSVARKLSRWLYRSVDMMLISSKPFEEKLRQMDYRGEIRYFPNYAEKLSDGGEETVTREKLGLSKDDMVIGFAGNVGVAQGLDKLVEAAKLNEKNEKVKYLIVGDGSELENVKSAVANAKMGDRFVFTGWQTPDSIPQYLGLCDILLVGLKDNVVLNMTVPAKLQTYMYAGKPVIAFMNGAGAEVVREADCGIAVEAENAKMLAEAIESLSGTENKKLAEMGANGKKYCDENYGREMIFDRLEEYLKKAIKEYKR